MRQYEKSLHLGLTVLLCALILRLFGEGLIPKTAALLDRPYIQDFLLNLETGQAVRSSSVSAQLSYAPESPPPEFPVAVPEETAPPETDPPGPEPIREEEADLLGLYNTSGLPADAGALLVEEMPLWEPGQPQVLIYSTHSTESYTQAGERYAETAAYRTLDGDYNMLSLGKALEEALEERRICVPRDETVHDYPSYNAAYSDARKTVAEILRGNPSIRLVLDLHRDAAGTDQQQLRTLAQVAGARSAQLMLVVGTDARGLEHPGWEENLSLALKLQVLLERHCPGITRPTCLRPQRFNQDFCPGCLLIEIGGAGNTRQEALTAIPVLAQAIEELIALGEAR